MEKIRKILNEFTGYGLGIMTGLGLAIFTEHGEMFNDAMVAGLVGIVAGALTIYIDFIIQPGQIFGFWTKFLDGVVKHPKNPLAFLYKPMGGCLYCMNTWVAFGVYSLVWYNIGLTWWFVFPCAAIAHVTVSILEPIVNG